LLALVLVVSVEGAVGALPGRTPLFCFDGVGDVLPPSVPPEVTAGFSIFTVGCPKVAPFSWAVMAAEQDKNVRISANTRRFAEDLEKTEFIKLDSPGECTESVYGQVPKKSSTPNLLDTAELLSVTPMRRSYAFFLTGPIWMWLAADLLPQKNCRGGLRRSKYK
jgi:hypothetical protein